MKIKTFETFGKSEEFIKDINFNLEKRDYWYKNNFNSDNNLWEVKYDVINNFEVGNIVKINTILEPIKYEIVNDVVGKVIAQIMVGLKEQ